MRNFPPQSLLMVGCARSSLVILGDFPIIFLSLREGCWVPAFCPSWVIAVTFTNKIVRRVPSNTQRDDPKSNITCLSASFSDDCQDSYSCWSLGIMSPKCPGCSHIFKSRALLCFLVRDLFYGNWKLWMFRVQHTGEWETQISHESLGVVTGLEF